MPLAPALDVLNLAHWYGQRQALCDVSLAVSSGEWFALLGPNGGGKTTLFRVISTLLPPQQGTVRLFGRDVRQRQRDVQALLGVVFQAPSLDRKLTVAENIRLQGALYGMLGRELDDRQTELLEHLGLRDRAQERVESLSGGLRRRVELAKAMLHRPRILLMDEPTTGLDPAARIDVWDYVTRLRHDYAVTVVFTTHLLEEADRVDRLAILHQGRVVAVDSPDALKETVGGDAITIGTAQPGPLRDDIQQELGAAGSVVDGQVRLELADGHTWIPRIMEAFPGRITSITLGKPTLEDVFIDRTGHRFATAIEESGDG